MSYPQNKTSYGGALLKTRRGRSRPRPISTTETMHVVMRASATNPFSTTPVAEAVSAILKKFAAKNGVELLGTAINHNHLHLHARFPSQVAYRRFIRAVSGAIPLAVRKLRPGVKHPKKFWQHRPFTRVVSGERDERTVRNYVLINEWEAHGYPRHFARFMAAMWRRGPKPGE